MGARFAVFVVFLIGLISLLFLNHFKSYDHTKKVAINLDKLGAPEAKAEVKKVVAKVSAKKRGEAIFHGKGQCFKCHGKKGEGLKAEEAPYLAGQYDWYIYSQLKNFKAKKRINEKMDEYIKDLTDDEFKDLSKYIHKM